MCSQCEQVNLVPVVATGCMDDLVEDGADYYYVVTAIAPAGKPSSSSNEIPASIPATKQTVSPTSTNYPLCRAPASK
jgi:hypothetical protein